ncbi:MAG: ribonuclease HII [Candidatus Cloacimonetes bacterium]|nr:ribonuclease HII [Candidatus Cloacimonadota bacterium]
MLFKNEKQFYASHQLFAGVDEAGRGPLAGPVVVASVILGKDVHFEGLNDSKKLSEKKREILFEQIITKAKEFHVEIVPREIIDEKNILQATLWGMEESILKLKNKPTLCLIDGNSMPKRIADISETVVKGDGKYASIAAASILAKVTRDRIMQKLHLEFPEYNFAKNKGYPTKEHLEAIRKHGITPHHRRSYKPVQQFTFNF